MCLKPTPPSAGNGATPANCTTQKCFLLNKEFGKCCVFNPNATVIDKAVDKYNDATLLELPKIDPNEAWSIDGLVDAYADQYGIEELSKLLYIFKDKVGGMGYTLRKASHWIDSWEVDHEAKLIFIDDDEIFSSRTNVEAAATMKDLIEREFEGQESFWDVTWRMTKGAGITVLGVGEVVVGVIGIIVPEPGTTAAGIAVTTFGASTTVEGVTQMFNLNEGKGYNPIEEGFALVGDMTGGKDGESMARTAFVFTNIIVSLGGSYKILKVPSPNGKFIFKGTYTGSGFTKYYKEGFSIGRLQMFYPLGDDAGKVIINVTNNSNQWVFRFQNFSGAIKLNARIINVKKLHRIDNPKEMFKILVKLALHGIGKKGVKLQ
ncbi:MAG: hypothetical protein D3903_15140 [Candidatus Electrothrix sp. GM3_4]|nr:hypothetical protein [Candidatus Electrothrix sp. GM3_4]